MGTLEVCARRVVQSPWPIQTETISCAYLTAFRCNLFSLQTWTSSWFARMPLVGWSYSREDIPPLPPSHLLIVPTAPRLPIPGPVFSISSPHITHVMVILQILKGTLKNMLIISQGYIFNRNKKIPTGETSSLPCCLFVTRLEQCTVLI